MRQFLSLDKSANYKQEVRVNNSVVRVEKKNCILLGILWLELELLNNSLTKSESFEQLNWRDHLILDRSGKDGYKFI